MKTPHFTAAQTESFRASNPGTNFASDAGKPRGGNSRSNNSLTGDSREGSVRFEPITVRRHRMAAFDRGLLERALEVLEEIETASPEDVSLRIESLGYVVSELWNSAAQTDIQHQSLLAMIEAFMVGRESVNRGQAVALRGAIKDLGGPSISEQHLEIIRSQFIDEGHNPLVILSELEGNPKDWEVGRDGSANTE